MKAYLLDPVIARYVFEHSTPPDPLLERLEKESAEATGEDAAKQISPDQGGFLTMITQIVAPTVAVEVGTFTGYSSVCIARGLSGGRLHCFDVSEEWTSMARRYWQDAGVADRVTLTLGPALETLAAFDETIDLAFLDADKENYPGYYELLISRMRPGGLLIVDNTLRRGHVADPAHDEATTAHIRRFNERVVKDPRVTVYMLPVADGMTMIRKR
ncbi:O-methyltransferase [Nonomuraea sp. KC401]|uniref:O-methyltransferase n=1 Tax=unclassified Nonomuraea TaxID=2593643 RepID=UPI0010FCF722|nr:MULTISPECIES: O-methyltransferase [unclassified Nonomuraea]NBE96090.1 SAM-dependent methyltransferase [Nonomuraea sp. K271]TLF80288.1 O-methyltransferase [Nonomuraea sp. KC401]